MAAVQHLIEMTQGAHHGHHVILDVGEVESDFRAGRNAVLVVAALGEAFDDIGFSRQETHEGIDLFAAFGDLAEERGEVVGAGDENLVFDGVRLVFDRGDHGPEAVDDVVTVTESVSGWGFLMPSVRGSKHYGVANPIRGQCHVVPQLSDPFPHVCCMWALGVRKRDNALTENNHVDIERIHVFFAGFVHLIERTEANEVVLLEEFNFLAGFLGQYVFSRQPMDAKGALECMKLVFRGVQNIEPPYTSPLRQFKQVTKGFARRQKIA